MYAFRRTGTILLFASNTMRKLMCHFIGAIIAINEEHEVDFGLINNLLVRCVVCGYEIVNV